MWIGNGDFESYGYLNDSAHIKGRMENLDPATCYQVVSRGEPNGPDQFHIIPVDAEGRQLGPAAIKTYGQAVYMYWEHGRSSPDYDISNRFIG